MTVAASTPIELIEGVYAALDSRVGEARRRFGRGLTRPAAGPTPRPPRFSPAPAPGPGVEPGLWATGPAAALPTNAKAGPPASEPAC